MKALHRILMAVGALSAAAGCMTPPDSAIGREDESAEGTTQSATFDAGARSNATGPTATADAGPEPLGPKAGGPETQWSGTLATTQWFHFGPADCRYVGRFENVIVSLRLTSDEKVISAQVNGRYVEQLNGQCKSEFPLVHWPSNQAYKYEPEKATTATFIAPGDTWNSPKAELLIDVATQSATSARATVRWKRTDFFAPYDWVSGGEQVILARK